MIYFDRIKFSNLGSYGDVPFELCFKDAKVFAFTGVNGSGKSTLLEAMALVLYNKPWRKVPKAKLVNTKNKRGTRVDIWFSDDSDEYQVTRGIKPDLFEIRRNGTLLNQDSKARDYQKYLEEEILKLSWDAFNQVVIIGKATYVPFMQLEAAKRRTFVESVLGLRVFTEMRDYHRSVVVSAEKLQAAAEAALGATKPAITTLTATLDEYAAMKADTSVLTVAQAQDALSALECDLAGARASVAAADAEYTQVETDARERLRSRVQSLEKEVKDAAAHHEAAAVEEAARRADCQAVSEFVNNENRDAARLEKDAAGIDTRTSCPTCGGPIDASSAERHRAELLQKAAEHRQAAAAAQADLDAATLALEQAKTAVTLASRAWRDAETRVAQVHSTPPSTFPEVREAAVKVTTAQASVTRIESDIRVAKNVLADATRRETELDGLIEAAMVKLEATEAKLTGLQAEVDQSHRTTQVFNVCTALLKDTGAKATIIRRYVPVINTIVNELLADMGFFARFELDDEFNDKILAQGFEEMTYNSFSEGEKLRIDMAVMLAWRELCILTGSSSTNLMIFDEILDGSFDEAGIDALMSSLTEKDNLHLICITHHPDRIDHFVETRLAFAKTDGYSGFTIATE